jgi:hypothetical protein
MGRDQMTDQEREELRQRLEDLREQLRQQGPGGGGERMTRLRRFSLRARGQGGQQGGSASQKRPCPANDPNCKPEDGESKDGEQEMGQEEGQGQGQGDGPTIVAIGAGGDKMLLMGKGQGSSQGQGTEGAGHQGDPQGEGGKSWGNEHDPRLTGKGTNPKMGTEDVQAAGLDTGQGASRSEVIQGAAQKGFRGGGYKKVYTEYRTSAEEQLHKDEVPPGMNDHVRRYFDLIRPRD